MADFCKVCGAEKYICQVCGRDLCVDERPPKWGKTGNVCPSCHKKEGRIHKGMRDPLTGIIHNLCNGKSREEIPFALDWDLVTCAKCVAAKGSDRERFYDPKQEG